MAPEHLTIPSALQPILLVDDDPISRSKTRAFLESLGHRVIEALDGEEAIWLLRTSSVETSLAILDIKELGWNESETLRSLRGLRPGLNTILCTGNNQAYRRRKDGLGVPPGSQHQSQKMNLHAAINRLLSNRAQQDHPSLDIHLVAPSIRPPARTVRTIC